MKISERVSQLAELGIHYRGRLLNDSDTIFAGDVIARFDGGEGIEYISLTKKGETRPEEYPLREEGLYQVLVAEIGPDMAETATQHGLMHPGRRVEVETHVILDRAAGMVYRFNLPARSYLSMSR